MEEGPNLSFGIQDSRAMLDKLGRELRRMRESSFAREDLVDSGVNFAITAWHLVEWVWADIKGQYSLIASLAREAGTPAKEFGCEQLRAYALRGCPSLEVCGAIANSAKHVGAEKVPKDVEETLVSAASASALGAISLGTTRLGVEHVLKIVSLGLRLPALTIFEAVFEWWQTFLDRHHISETKPK